MENFLKRCSSTSTIYHAISKDKKDNRISIYDNVPTPKTIDKTLNQFNNSDEELGQNSFIHRAGFLCVIEHIEKFG